MLRSPDAHDSKNSPALDRERIRGVPPLRRLPGTDGKADFAQRPLAPRGDSRGKITRKRRAFARTRAGKEPAAARRSVRSGCTLGRRSWIQPTRYGMLDSV